MEFRKTSINLIGSFYMLTVDNEYVIIQMERNYKHVYS